VIFVAFSGGLGAAREAYMRRGGHLFTLVIVLLYLGLGIAVPAAVIADRDESKGAIGHLRADELSAREEGGKQLFIQTCSSCHNLDAVNARGVTGPDLDELGGLDRQRVLNAIRRGGTGQGRMPAELLEGEAAEDVALYVSRVAGQ
jgi:mono/diheme cytochrome c family protein